MSRKSFGQYLVLIFGLLPLIACGPTAEAIEAMTAAAATYTPVPTETPLPTSTSTATATPTPTSTSTPTQTPLPTKTPRPTSTATPSPIPTSDTGVGSEDMSVSGNDGIVDGLTLTVVNDLTATVCGIYISPTASEYWGDNWLGPNSTMPAGSSRAFTIEPGIWDLNALDCDGHSLSETYEHAINGDATWSLASTSTAIGTIENADSSVIVVNNSAMDICFIYITPPTSDMWGGDWLGSNYVPAGTSHTLPITAGTWDVMARNCDGQVMDEQYGVAINGDWYWQFGP
jgi:hypothetical protein